MGWAWDLLRIRSAFSLDLAAPLPDVVCRMRSRVLPARPSVPSGGQGYAGEVTARGFAVRRLGRAMAVRGETWQAVEVRGEFRGAEDWTRVAVVIRHSRILVSVLWLFSGLAVLGLAMIVLPPPRGEGRPETLSSAAVAAVFAAIAVSWYLGFWSDIRRVRREIVALLTNEAADGPPKQAPDVTGGV